MARQPVTAPVADPAPVADAAPATPTAPEPPTPSAEPTDVPIAAEEDGDAVEARALIAFGDYGVDDIVTASPAAIAAFEADGKVDPHPDAVAYAKSLQG